MELNILLGGGMIREYDRHHDRPGVFEDFHGGQLSGVNSKLATGDTANLVSIMKVLFKSYGALPFLPFPASEVFNQPVSLETLWGSAANDVGEQLWAARTAQTKFHILEEFLLARLHEDRAPHPAVVYAVQEFQTAHGKRPVSEVTEYLGFSPKRFIHLFREAVGLTPKLFCRIQRFQQVLYLIEHEEHPIEWADMATANGYFDQAHLIHDFQTFSGSTPEAYHKRSTPQHLHRTQVQVSGSVDQQKRKQRDAIRREAAHEGALNDDLPDQVHGLNASSYPIACRRSLNKDLRQHSDYDRRAPLIA